MRRTVALAEARNISYLPEDPKSNDDLAMQLWESMWKGDSSFRPLTDRELLCVTLRYGLDGHGERKLHEIGNAIGVSRNRVRQLLQRAIRKLRHPSRSRNLREFLES